MFSKLFGGPDPDLFRPRMPEVDPVPDPAALFARARSEAAAAHSIPLVTPGRMIAMIPIPPAGSIAEAMVAGARSLLASDTPLKVSFIGYTAVEAFTKDKAKTLPFLGGIIGIAYCGHDVLIFEGHRSVFEAGVRDCDVLIVDGAMVEFLDKDWAETAWRVLKPGGRILAHSRQTQGLLPVIRSSKAPGWRVSEPDGEGSYVNCLLLTLARGPVGVSAEVVSGNPPPNLANLTSDPSQLEWIAELPFQYEKLSADAVLRIVQGTSGKTGTLRANMAGPGGERRPVAFEVSSVSPEGRSGIRIVRA